MKLREIFFGTLLFIVIAATAWRMLTPRDTNRDAVTVTDERPAPAFQLLDQNGRPAQLQGYLNRHRILLVFFDGRKGINGDPLMNEDQVKFLVLASDNKKFHRHLTESIRSCIHHCYGNLSPSQE